MEFKLSKEELLEIQNAQMRIDLLNNKVNFILFDFYEQNNIKRCNVSDVDFSTGIIKVVEEKKEVPNGSNK